MGPGEPRLRAMGDKDSIAYHHLDDEDRASIQWAFDRIATLENELKESRQYWFEADQKIRLMREKIGVAVTEIAAVLK